MQREIQCASSRRIPVKARFAAMICVLGMLPGCSGSCSSAPANGGAAAPPAVPPKTADFPGILPPMRQGTPEEYTASLRMIPDKSQFVEAKLTVTQEGITATVGAIPAENRIAVSGRFRFSKAEGRPDAPQALVVLIADSDGKIHTSAIAKPADVGDGVYQFSAKLDGVRSGSYTIRVGPSPGERDAFLQEEVTVR